MRGYCKRADCRCDDRLTCGVCLRDAGPTPLGPFADLSRPSPPPDGDGAVGFDVPWGFE